jgi:hypothetical protein
MRSSKLKQKKLLVSKEKVRELDQLSLEAVAGGLAPQGIVHTAPCSKSYTG